MEPAEGVSNLDEVNFIQHVPVDEIIKIKECPEGLDDLLRNESLNR